MERERASYSPLFLTEFALFLTSLLISNIIAGKLIQVAGIVLPAAVILFPITYILGDVFTEVYGFQRTRIIIWLGFAANLLMSLLFLATIALPYPQFFKDQGAFATVLGMTPRIVFASLVGYWAGEFGNSIVLSIMKKTMGGKYLWMRTIGSTIIGEGLDTVLFIGIAFWGGMPTSALLQMMLAQYLFKVLYEALFTPLTYFVVGRVKKLEGVDVYDNGVVYNPFRLRK
ncbi:MAG TPA: queuosine precursor transporter [Spirochaetales bacterium]|nr:queuosine precursor transporter [Spirochaetales bacterium]HPS14796.1 queuosine precursor transporter [Spirochaetales bacterium]